MRLRGTAYAVAASFMFGLGAVLAKLVGGEIDATVVAFLALAGGGLLLAIGLVLTRRPLVQALKRAGWLDLLLLACPGTAIPLLLIVAGFARTSALAGGFLLQLNGVAALLFAVLLLRERVRLKQGIGVLLLLIGSVLVIFKGSSGSAGSNGGLGDLLIVAGAIGLGFGFVPAKRLSQRAGTLALTMWRLLLGACTLLPVLAIQLLVGTHTLRWQPSAATLWALLLYIVSNFCLGYLAQQEGLRLLKAWEMGALMQTVPLFSTLFALLLLHDSLTLVQALGGLLAILGGIVVSLSDRAPTPVATQTETPLQDDIGTVPAPHDT
ncbi:MAG: DMT family transporter [Ktedonobacteraceae bacterium]|nr:DMT family transporter [Chloroflexota bacterium]